MKRQYSMMLVGAAALLQGATALGGETQTINPEEFFGTKPIVRSLRAGQAPRVQPTTSPEAFARWDVAQGKPVVRLLRAERERRVQVAPEFPMVASPCWGMKPAIRTPGNCGEGGLEVGSASGRP